MGYAKFGKRLVDTFIGVVALLILLPVLVITAIAIVINDGRPIFFSQERIGKDSSVFRVHKFRSMKTDAADVPSVNASSDMITSVGKVIRRTNIDELPQLVSVLRGEMSIVGPRPALQSQTVLLGLRNKSGAAALRPGLTGLAQVNAYDGMTEEEKARFDAEYSADIRFISDVAILLRTVGYLFRRPPVY